MNKNLAKQALDSKQTNKHVFFPTISMMEYVMALSFWCDKFELEIFSLLLVGLVLKLHLCKIVTLNLLISQFTPSEIQAQCIIMDDRDN